MSDIDAIADVLRGHGISETADDLHDYRCYVPDRYGRCDCFAELLTAIEGVLVGGDAAEAAQVGSEGAGGPEAGSEVVWRDGDALIRRTVPAPFTPTPMVDLLAKLQESVNKAKARRRADRAGDDE